MNSYINGVDNYKFKVKDPQINGAVFQIKKIF